MLNRKWPQYTDAETAAVVAIMHSGKVNYWTGEEGKRFEEEFANYLDVSHALSVANGTLALELCLYALGIGPGDEVIVPCRTFMASASCVVARGAKPVICDIDLISQNLTIETINAVLTPKTKAIIAVHLAGWPCAMDEIMAFANEHQLYVIEDCAQAHGAAYKGKKVGSYGHMAAFSFCQDKIISTLGEGGMVTTNNEALWRKAWSYRDHGKDYDIVHDTAHPPGFRWQHSDFGSNYRLTEVQAAVGRIQLKALDQWVKIRREHAEIFTKTLQSLPALRLTIPSPEAYHAYYRYYCFLKLSELKPDWSYQRLVATLRQENCLLGNYSCPEIYLEQAFKKHQFGPKQRFAQAEALGASSLAFLVDPIYTSEEIENSAALAAEIIQTASVNV